MKTIRLVKIDTGSDAEVSIEDNEEVVSSVISTYRMSMPDIYLIVQRKTQ